MPKYILLFRAEDEDNWHMIEGDAQTEMSFLEEVDDHILSKEDWIVYEVVRGTHKDEYLHSGQIDELVENPEEV